MRIGVGNRHIAILHGQVDFFCFAPQRLFDGADESHQFHRLVIANIVQRVRAISLRRLCQHAQDAFDNIVDIGEIALQTAVIEHLDWLTAQDGFGKQPRRHIGPTPGAIHGKKAQTRGRQLIQMAVAGGHHFVGFFAGGVKTHRLVGAVIFGKRRFGVFAVHRRRAGVHQMLHRMLAAGFQNMGHAQQIGLCISMRILDRVAHPGLRRQVNHRIRALFGKQGIQRRPVGHVQWIKLQAGLFTQGGQPGVLEADGVIVVEIIHSHHLVAGLEQRLSSGAADKSGSAGEQYFHLLATLAL